MSWSGLAKRAVLPLILVWLFSAGILIRGKSPGQWESSDSAGMEHTSGSFAIADFDGDQKPDIASVKSDRTERNTTSYSIHFKLSEGVQPAIGIIARTGGLELFWRDVNGDDALDLVVRTSLDSSLVAVLLNDGHGRFAQAPPENFPGLKKEPEFCLTTQIQLPRDGVSSLPSRTTSGEHNDQTLGVLLQPFHAILGERNNHSYGEHLDESSAGRSPPIIG
jgi:hypothetical protein